MTLAWLDVEDNEWLDGLEEQLERDAERDAEHDAELDDE